MAVPNIFANVTTTIPLSQLDTNFATAITLGNTAVYLGNTTTALGNLTLNNVTIASGTASGNLSTGNVTVSGTLGVTGATTLSSTLAAGNTTITGTGTFSGGIVGTTTNNAAAAGCVGEYVSSTIAPGSAVTITTTVTSQDITTISLTAGDWLVSINGAAQSTGSVTARIFFWIGTIAGNDASEATAGTMADFNYALPVSGTVPGAVPSYRMSLASTTTVRYKAWANFSGTQPTMQGRISATRVR